MKFDEIKTGKIFNLGNTPSYPKLKTDKGYVDMRDEIVNDNPNQVVLKATITLMSIGDLAKQFTESEQSIKAWVKELKQKYLITPLGK